MRNNKWARLLAYVTGSVNQELLLQSEYLAAENRILRSRLPKRLRLSNRLGAEGSGHSGSDARTSNAPGAYSFQPSGGLLPLAIWRVL